VFTGLVREVGRIAGIVRHGSITRLEVSAPRTAPTLAVGDSVAIDGICLTVTGLSADRFAVEATAETRRVTTLGRWKRRGLVHLEPSLRAGEAIGGHFVLGHVDGVGRVARVERNGAARSVRVAVPAALAARLVPKGAIALDGVSLTLDEGPFRGALTVTLVPHTLAATHLADLAPGDQVNLELDVLVKAARTMETSTTPGPAVRVTTASLLARGWERRPR
jgi:riboflavin synthase